MILLLEEEVRYFLNENKSYISVIKHLNNCETDNKILILGIVHDGSELVWNAIEVSLFPTHSLEVIQRRALEFTQGLLLKIPKNSGNSQENLLVLESST